MMTINDIKEYIVCLNGGSGVIFQPANPEHTYILTAKHVFDDVTTVYNGKIIIHYYNKNSNEIEPLPELDLLVGDNYFPHTGHDIDIAIIKVDRIESSQNIIVTDSYFTDTKDYILSGYPKTRRDANNGTFDLNSIRIDDKIDILQQKEFKRVEADISKNQNREELKGTSGGGIFKISGNYLLFAGIQSQVANGQETLGRIEFTPISIFSEIVQANDQLEAIIPAYLKSFSFLKEDSFQMQKGLLSEEIIDEVSQILRNQTQNVIDSDFTPNCIKEYLGETVLLLHGQAQSSVYLRPLWLSWLEVLTILNIAKQKSCVKGDFEEIFKNIRFFYSSTDKDFWVAHLEDLAKSDYKGLQENGLVVVSSGKPAEDNLHILVPKDIPQRIDRIKRKYQIENQVTGQALNIDNANDFPLEKFRFANISAFKEEPIAEGFLQFKDIPVGDIIPKLKLLYEQLIK